MTLALQRPPTGPLSIRVETVPAGRLLHRNHDRAYTAAAFNSGRGQPSRFAPFSAAGRVVPSLYAATSREAAAHETLFHDIEALNPTKVVRRAVVDSRLASTISARRDLRLATLFTPDLMPWGIARSQMIDTPKTAYVNTVVWARALHSTDPAIDGLMWASRRCDPELCLVLFGDRVGSADIEIVDSLAVAGDAALTAEFHAFADRAGIAIVT